MGVSIMAYNSLSVLPYELNHLLELKISKKINDHARLYFTGIVPEEAKDSYVQMTKCQTQVQVNEVDENGDSLIAFKGIILNIEVKAVNGIYYIKAEAVSNTYNMDIKLNKRSFQDPGMTYKSIVDKVISSYSRSDTIDTASNGKTIGKLILQYNETDWEFIKRLASHFNTGLVPEAKADSPKFWFGIPERSSEANLDDFNYSVKKKISEFRRSSENFIQGINENDFIYYEVETNKILEIGSRVKFKDKLLLVCEVESLMKDGILLNRYTMAPKNGLNQNILYNNQIIGLSLQGKVISVSGDNVKVHLEIDDGQGSSDVWNFKYASMYTAEGSSGWYCMPEVNDSVRIYFQDNKEENAIAVSSVRRNSTAGANNKLSDPNVKYFRTKSGKELMFGNDEILITASDGNIFIRLNEGKGIEIYSNKDIKITSKKGITMDAEKKVVIAAKDEIDMSCKESSISMNGVTTIKGNEVKNN